jgi:hypothetical protein
LALRALATDARALLTGAASQDLFDPSAQIPVAQGDGDGIAGREPLVASQHGSVWASGQAVASVENLEWRKRVELARQRFEWASPIGQKLRSEPRQAVFEQAQGGALVRNAALGMGAQETPFDKLQILAPSGTRAARCASCSLGEIVEGLAAVVDESARVAEARARSFEHEAPLA